MKKEYKKWILSLLSFSFILLFLDSNATTGYLNTFKNGISNVTTSSPALALSSQDNLQITATNVGSQYENIEVSFLPIDIRTNQKLKIGIKVTKGVSIRIDLRDSKGNSTNASPLLLEVSPSANFSTYELDFSGKFQQSWPAQATVDPSQITEIIVFFNAGKVAYSGQINVNYLSLGNITGVASTTRDIKLNQLGFYPLGEKKAVIKNATTSSFSILDALSQDTVFSGVLSGEKNWKYSNEKVRIADFSTFTKEGKFLLNVNGLGSSVLFEIRKDIFQELNKALLRMYYYQRSSIPIQAAYGGDWARDQGTPDANIVVHSSASSPSRSSETIISSPKGWYDAGDYGKYTVNSSISTFTLLSFYEHFTAYCDSLSLNLPESNNSLPDILDEIKWNLDWMLSMQLNAPGMTDDGLVYHKLTSLDWDPSIMPSNVTSQRYVVGISTESALDFAAIFAQAYRIFKKFDNAYADKCLQASKKAYLWSTRNPSKPFLSNPQGVVTGEYKNSDISQCFAWAGSELFLATSDLSYFPNDYLTKGPFIIPRWDSVGVLGLISLSFHSEVLSSLQKMNVNNKLLEFANRYLNETTSSAYGISMGSLAQDFAWGSNSFSANQGIVLLQAYRITKKAEYLHAAISCLDYLLGRNALSFSFVTGFGEFSPKNPHHRPMEADGNSNPIPGFVVGGPQNDNNPEDCPFQGTYPATKYSDNICSYSTNEVAINWNAPVAYLSGALESIMNDKDCNGAFPSLNKCQIAGMEEEIIQTDFLVFPNPAKETLSIHSPSRQAFSYRIIDIDGTEVHASNSQEGMAQVQLGLFSSGLYSAIITYDNHVKILRFVVNR